MNELMCLIYHVQLNHSPDQFNQHDKLFNSGKFGFLNHFYCDVHIDEKFFCFKDCIVDDLPSRSG